MLKIEFKKSDVTELQYLSYKHPHPHVQRKSNVLLLFNSGMSTTKIANTFNISSNTVRNYMKEYKNKGLDSIKEVGFNKPQSKLIEHKSTLEEYFKANPQGSLKEAAHNIEQLTGIKRSVPQVRSFLLSIGIKYRKI